MDREKSFDTQENAKEKDKEALPLRGKLKHES